MSSPRPYVRHVHKVRLQTDRDRSISALAARIANRSGDQDDRVSAAITLGRIRGVSEEGARALIVMLIEERPSPEQPLTEHATPASLALVRIGLPIVPFLTHEIINTESSRARRNSVAVMAVMLGEHAEPWLADATSEAPADVQEDATAALASWSDYLDGQGYHAAAMQEGDAR
jgi:hypothetical protein